MTLDPWLLFLHVAAAIIWVGGGVMLCLVGSRARVSQDPAVIGEFSRTLCYTDLPAARQALNRWLTGYAVVLVILLFAFWDMVIKPGT